MKDISLPKKLKVIKLFFAGYTYDEIAEEVGIAKGSVANVIDAFRDGELQIAPNEYIDAFRELAVDIRKQHTTVKKLQMYTKIDNKVSEMGVGIDQAEDWLDVAHDIATNPAEMKPFVSASLELSQMEVETGLDCSKLVAEYKDTLKNLNALKVEVTNTVKLKEEAGTELDAVNKARKEAQEDLENYLAQKQLTLNTVNTVAAILDGEFSKEGLSEEDKIKISKRIAETASISIYNQNIKKENDELEK